MINFYKFYNTPGLDNDHYGPLLDQLTVDRKYTIELKPIEHLIKNDSGYACTYARLIIKGRWIEAETNIMKYPLTAFWYASNIMNQRWSDAEQYIMKDPHWWKAYCKEFNIC